MQPAQVGGVMLCTEPQGNKTGKGPRLSPLLFSLEHDLGRCPFSGRVRVEATPPRLSAKQVDFACSAVGAGTKLSHPFGPWHTLQLQRAAAPVGGLRTKAAAR